MRIRLTRELAQRLDSLALSSHAKDTVVELPRYEAELFIAEGWAIRAEELQTASGKRPQRPQLLVTTTLLTLRTVEQLRRMREVQAMKQYQFEARRRAEDRIRDELHDLRAKTITGSVEQLS